MYVPNHFSMTDEQIAWMLDNYPFGELITKTDRGFDATFLAFTHHEETGKHLMRSHMNRANLQWKDEGNALIILRGPWSYVSPAWYPSVQEGNNVVPTLDYLTLQLHGKLKAVDSYDFLIEHLRDLVAKVSPEQPALDPKWVKRMLRAAVGVEFEITRLDAKAKMSQNAKPKDIEGIIEGLSNGGAEPEFIAFLTEVSLPHAKNREAELDRIRSFTLVGESSIDHGPSSDKQITNCPFLNGHLGN